MDNQVVEIKCQLIVSSTNLELRKINAACTGKRASIQIGRDTRRNIIILIQYLGKHQISYFLTSNCSIHRKYAKDGQATIVIPERSLQLEICNGAPRPLLVFTKLLEGKLKLLKSREKNYITSPKRTPIANRRLTSKQIEDLPIINVLLSPLTVEEIKKILSIDGVLPQQNLKTPLRDRTNLNTQHGKRRSPGNTNMAVTPKRRCSFDGSQSSANRRIISQTTSLTEEWAAVLRNVLAGRNVFFTGAAGTGKSYLLNQIVQYLPAKTTVVTAATGVAACQIGGTTLHTWAGIGSGDKTFEQLISFIARQKVCSKWRQCTHLIIDECSMVDGDYFEKLERVARYTRENDKPFGGIQLVLCGDFLQLPPVNKSGEDVKFCFQTGAWAKSIATTIVLKQIHRQKDSRFIQMLNEIRMGRLKIETVEALRKTFHNVLRCNDGIVPTRLCTHRRQADDLNSHMLKKLETEEHYFTAHDSEDLMRFNIAIPNELTLKIGAQVMLTKNIDLSKQLCNGSRGVITSFNETTGYPVVRFSNRLERPIGPIRFAFKTGSGNESGAPMTAYRTQLPLQLAWALSVHKSQGMSLDRVEVSMSRAFECGQAYVALSRAKSLDGLRILDMDVMNIRANSDVLRFYESIDGL